MHVPFVPWNMPKSTKKGSSRSKSSGGSRTVTATIPKSLSSSIDRIRAKLDTVDSTLREHIKTFNNQAKAWSKQMSEQRASVGRAPRAKRKPSEYNLFLKDKMKQGMTMTEAVQAWKARGGGVASSSMSGSSMSMGEEEGESSTEEEA